MLKQEEKDSTDTFPDILSEIKNKKRKSRRYILYTFSGIFFLFFSLILLVAEEEYYRVNKEETLNMLSKHKLKRIVIVNGKKGEIYLTREAIENKTIPFDENQPRFQVDISDWESFEDDIYAAQEEFSESEMLYPEYETRHNLILDIFNIVWPLTLLVGFAFLFIRTVY